jgi:exopolyphosphatase/pppGpp-phosphohydrolase
VVQAVMDRVLAAELTVAGYGLREGIALRSVTDEAASIADVQRAAVAALGAQFTEYDSVRAERRAMLSEKLLKTLAPGLSAEATLAAVAAARLLDIGASIDHYRRHMHTARIVADANLDGFSHRTLALIAASVYAVGEREASIKGYAPLLSMADQPVVEQIAAAVALADALVMYGSADPETTAFERSNQHVVLATPVMDSWPIEPSARRAERAFHINLKLGEAVRAG